MDWTQDTTDDTIPENEGTLKWSYTSESTHDIKSCPAIGHDGMTYIISADYNGYGEDVFFNAIDENGNYAYNVLLHADTSYIPDNLNEPFAIDSGGRIYIADGGAIVEINGDGGSYSDNFNLTTSPVVDTNGTLYFNHTDLQGDDGAIKASNPDGSGWRFNSTTESDRAHEYYSVPSIGIDNTIFAIGHYYHFNADLLAINPDGTEKWMYAGLSTNSTTTIAVGNTDILYFGSENTLYAINPDGTESWTYDTGSTINSTPIIGVDGTIYFGCQDNNIYALDYFGNFKWSYSTDAPVLYSGAIGNNGIIYFPSSDNNIYAINPNGVLRWKYDLGETIHFSIILTSDGTLYIATSNTNSGSTNTTFSTFVSSSTGPADSAWPMVKQNAQGTGSNQ